MAAITILLAAIEARLTALGFDKTDEVFDFNAVPASVIDKAYRIDVKMLSNAYYSGNIGNPRDAIEIWIAYKMKRNARTVRDAALADRETIEKDLVTNATILALASNPLLTMDGEASMQKELENYLVLKLTFTADYLRSLA
jgi:hypothetical protein